MRHSNPIKPTIKHLKLRLYDKIRRKFSRGKFCERTLFLSGILYRILYRCDLHDKNSSFSFQALHEQQTSRIINLAVKSCHVILYNYASVKFSNKQMPQKNALYSLVTECREFKKFMLKYLKIQEKTPTATNIGWLMNIPMCLLGKFLLHNNRWSYTGCIKKN